MPAFYKLEFPNDWNETEIGMTAEKTLNSVYAFPFAAMGSDANEVRIAAINGAAAFGLAQLASQEVLRVEAKYSRYRPDSIASLINSGAGKAWVVCDEETLSLISYGEALFQASEGRFDMTSGVLRRAWDFKSARLPSQSKLNDLLELVDWSVLERQGNRVRLPNPGMELDFGGIGKEYAADRAATKLIEAGVTSGFVNLAGDLAVIGPQPDGRPWQIGIPAPRKKDEMLASLAVAQGGLATSGDSERFFELQGKRYCHILNPQTGYPVSHWQSVSVLAPTASIAGSCSTIAMLLEENGLQFLEESGFGFLAVDHLGKVHQYSI
jgi:FAD:protein FMN transferase